MISHQGIAVWRWHSGQVRSGMKKYIRPSILTPVAIGVVIIIYLIEALTGNPPVSSQGDLTETFYPILLSVVGIPFVIKLIRDGIREANDTDMTKLAIPRKSIGVALAIGIFVLGFGAVGFAVAAPVFVFMLQFLFDDRVQGVFRKALGSVLIAVVVYLLYVYGFDIRLPIIGGA